MDRIFIFEKKNENYHESEYFIRSWEILRQVAKTRVFICEHFSFQFLDADCLKLKSNIRH